VAFALKDEFNTFVAALTKENMVDELSGDEPLTVFMPSDEAFLKNACLVAKLLLPCSRKILDDILEYHVVGGKIEAANLQDGDELETYMGDNLVVSIKDNIVKINEAQVVVADIQASNGVIHQIDTVLTPSDFPDFADFDSSELPYECESDDSEDKTVPQVVAVMEALKDRCESDDAQDKTIPQVAFALKDEFNTFVAALTKENMVDELSGDEPLTVFMPSDEAFLKNACLVAKLLLPCSRKILDDILEYHVVGGKIEAANLQDGDELETYMGDNLVVSIKDNIVKINEAQVVVADIQASNGVIHQIDTVLTPTDHPDFADFDSSELPYECESDDSEDKTIPQVVAVMEALKDRCEFDDAEDIPPVAFALKDEFNTFVAALTELDAVETLSDDRDAPFTVFAPSDEAFLKIACFAAELLLPCNQEDLSDLIEYHILFGVKIEAADLKDGDELESSMGEGYSLVVSIKDDIVKINESQVVATIQARNGIIHQIDTVLKHPDFVDFADMYASKDYECESESGDPEDIIVPQVVAAMEALKDRCESDNASNHPSDDSAASFASLTMPAAAILVSSMFV